MSGFSVLTFNTGLLRVSLLGKVLAEPTPFIAERYARLAGAIAGVDADVVALQEIYFGEHREGLVSSLRTEYPHVARHERRRWPNRGNGLLVLSRFPLEATEYLRFTDVDLLERIFVGKGALIADVRLPGGETVSLANLHTTAGGTAHTESARANAMRRGNLEAVIRRIRERAGDGRVVMGDFNAGPQASRENYEQMLAARFRDVALGTPAADGITWDPENPLNRRGPHEDCPAQRIDHVFVDTTTAWTPRAQEVRLVFQEPCVDTPAGRVTLSDHYGLFARFA